MSLVAAAAAAVIDYEAWAKTPDGTWVPQSSGPDLVQEMLEPLDLQPGQRVLKIGTGSGYSAALLAHIVGPAGHIVSLDVDAALMERANRLHRHAGHRRSSSRLRTKSTGGLRPPHSSASWPGPQPICYPGPGSTK